MQEDVSDGNGSEGAEDLSLRTLGPTTSLMKLRGFTDGFENLFLVGRAGCANRTSNPDHMRILAALTVVDGLAARGHRTRPRCGTSTPSRNITRRRSRNVKKIVIGGLVIQVIVLTGVSAAIVFARSDCEGRTETDCNGPQLSRLYELL